LKQGRFTCATSTHDGCGLSSFSLAPNILHYFNRLQLSKMRIAKCR
jgi:hypothetical protein